MRKAWTVGMIATVYPAFLLGVLIILSTGALSGETLRVGPGEAYTDIQSAIDAAKDGDTVLVDPGEYTITRPLR